MTAEEFVQRLEHVSRSGSNYTARCPAHDDKKASLSVGDGRDGRVLLYCHAGCDFSAICDAAGVNPKELSGNSRSGPEAGYTLEEFGRDKGLPTAFLREQGLHTHRQDDRPDCVAIPCHDAEGSTLCTRYRTAERFWWDRGTKPVPYGLDRLAKSKPEEPVLLVEGESDSLTCWHHDVLAVGIPGADMWRSEWRAHLKGRPVTAWQEPEQGGETFVRKLVADFPDLRVICAPDGIKDPSELHLADPDHFRSRLESLMRDAVPLAELPVQVEPPKQDETEGKDAAELPQKKVLLNLTSGQYFFSDEHDRPYVQIDVKEHYEIWPLDGSRFKSWLAHLFYKNTGAAASASIRTDVLAVLTGRALFDGACHELAVRLARGSEGELWYDLTDAEWRAIRIDGSGYEIVDSPPLLFRRYKHQKPQIEPEPGGSLRDLLLFLNLASPEDEILVLVWLIAAFIPDIPRAILVLWGAQGSAKSTLIWLLRAIIDPSSVPTPLLPRGSGELAQVLDHNALVCLDNLSSLNPQMSDTLCRAVTGDGFSKRKLYSDDDDILYHFRRPIVLGGINIAAQRPDLLDRCVLIRLEEIPGGERRRETELLAAFEAALPRILGAIFTILARAIALEPTIRLNSLPRMADWAKWGYAIAEAAGLGGERFLDIYSANRATQNEEALTSHPIGAAVAAFMVDRDDWTGEPSELLRRLEGVAEKEMIDTKQKLWPKAGNWLRRRINEVESNLLQAGIRYESGQGNGRFLRLWRDDPTANLEGRENAGGAGGAGGSQATPDDSAPQHAPGIFGAEGMPGGAEGMPGGAEGMPGGREAASDKGSPGTPSTPGISQTSYLHRQAGEETGDDEQTSSDTLSADDTPEDAPEERRQPAPRDVERARAAASKLDRLHGDHAATSYVDATLRDGTRATITALAAELEAEVRSADPPPQQPRSNDVTEPAQATTSEQLRMPGASAAGRWKDSGPTGATCPDCGGKRPLDWEVCGACQNQPVDNHKETAS